MWIYQVRNSAKAISIIFSLLFFCAGFSLTANAGTREQIMALSLQELEENKTESSLSKGEEKTTEADTYHQLDSYVRYLPSRSVDAMSGKVEIIESGCEYNYGFKLFHKLPVKFSIDTQYIGIEDTLEDLELPAHLTGVSMGLETTLPFFNLDETYQRLGITPSFYSDDFEFETSSFRLPLYYFLIRRPNEKWTFLAGIAFYPDYEDELLPILGVIYQPNERLIFNLIPKGPNITYIINRRLALFAEGGGALNSEFEVDRGIDKNVVLRYKGMRLGGGVKFKINPAIESSFSVGAAFNRSFKYRDNQGKVNLKDGLYAEFRLEIKS